MLGGLVAEYSTCLTDESGAMIVSFKVVGKNRLQAKNTLVKVKEAIVAGKHQLKVDIDNLKEKRSTSANSYFWTLCTAVANVLKTSKLDIYRKYIKESGIFKKIELNNEAVDTFITAWKMHGEGWIAEKIDSSDINGFSMLFAYYGSSVYNKKQMATLIDSIVQDCQDLGIETKTPQQIAEILSLWEEEKKH